MNTEEKLNAVVDLFNCLGMDVYFEGTLDGTSYLCLDGGDMGIDLQDGKIGLYIESDTFVTWFEFEDGMQYLKDHIEDYTY